MYNAKRILIHGFAVAVAIGTAIPALAGGHTWRVNEIFSNADGTIQFIEVKEFFGGNGETATAGHNVTSNTRSFTIPNNVVPPTGFKHILLATPGFVGLPGAPTPDYVFPAGSVPFFATTGDTIRYVPYCSYTFGAGVLPTNGINSLTLTSHEAHAFTIAANSPTNYAGQTGSINVGCALGSPCGDPGSGECDNPDTCDAAGVCQPNNISGPCTDEGNPCTNDVCAGGACTHPNNTAPCDDGLFCTDVDVCSGGTCTGSGNPCPPETPFCMVPYGDLVFPFGVVDVDDILFVLDSFSTSTLGGDIEPCGGDGDVDVDDILSELAAFAGTELCPPGCQ